MTHQLAKLASLSMKSLGFSAKEIRKQVEGKKEGVFLGRITGIAAGFFTGESSNGEFVGFRGSFMAVNNRGEVFEAATAFLPSSISKPLRETLEKGATEIETKADIYAVESDKNASGYSYICEPVLNDQSHAKLKAMQNSLMNNLPAMAQIAAPEKSDTKAAKKSA